MLNIMGTFEIETVISLNGNMSVILKEAISRKKQITHCKHLTPPLILIDESMLNSTISCLKSFITYQIPFNNIQSRTDSSTAEAAALRLGGLLQLSAQSQVIGEMKILISSASHARPRCV